MHMIPMIRRIIPPIPIDTAGHQAFLIWPLPPLLPGARDPLLPNPLPPHHILTLHCPTVLHNPLRNRLPSRGLDSALRDHHVRCHAVAVVRRITRRTLTDAADFADFAGEGGHDGLGAVDGGRFAAGGGGGDGGGWVRGGWGGAGGHAAFECGSWVELARREKGRGR
jgi:hypothetical protein